MKFKDLVKLFGMVNVTSTDKELRCSCPLAPWTHEHGTDSSPSFSIKVMPNKAVIYNCFSCKSSGKLEHLLQVMYDKTKNHDFLRALLYIDEVSGQIEDDGPTYPKSLVLRKEIYENIFEDIIDYIEARDYIKSRGISIDTCSRLGIKYDPDERRIVFMVYDYNNNLVGYVGRAIDKENKVKARNKNGLPVKYVYLGMHKLCLDKPTILVEGLFMYLKMHEYGLDSRYNILANLGSNISKQKKEFLQGVGLPLYLFFDNDKAGNNGAYGVSDIEQIPKALLNTKSTGAASQLSKHILVYRVIYPEGITDPDDLTISQVNDMLNNAELVRKK